MWAEALWAHPGTMREGIDGSMYVIWVWLKRGGGWGDGTRGWCHWRSWIWFIKLKVAHFKYDTSPISELAVFSTFITRISLFKWAKNEFCPYCCSCIVLPCSTTVCERACLFIAENERLTLLPTSTVSTIGLKLKWRLSVFGINFIILPQKLRTTSSMCCHLLLDGLFLEASGMNNCEGHLCFRVSTCVLVYKLAVVDKKLCMMVSIFCHDTYWQGSQAWKSSMIVVQWDSCCVLSNWCMMLGYLYIAYISWHWEFPQKSKLETKICNYSHKNFVSILSGMLHGEVMAFFFKWSLGPFFMT